MEIYGVEGYIKTLDDTNIKIRNKNKSEQHLIITQEQVPVYRDPFSYFGDVIRGKIKLLPFSLYTLENNIIVVRILEAAKISAKTGKTVFISK
jgi:predicted dehydrogenase